MTTKVAIRYQTTDGQLFGDYETAALHQVVLDKQGQYLAKEKAIVEALDRDPHVKQFTNREFIHWIVRNWDSL